AQSALDKTQATLQTTQASQTAALQTAQNTVAQNQAALQTQIATAASTLAPPTQNDLDSAAAALSNAQAAVATAQGNLDGATSNVVTYSVLIAADPTDVQLLPGMTATVTIVTEQDNNAVLVPNSAIAYAKTQPGSGTAVYVLQNGAPARVAIQTGSTDNTNTV